MNDKKLESLGRDVLALQMIVFATIEAGDGPKRYLRRLRSLLSQPNCITVGGMDTAAIREAAAGMVRGEIAQNEPITLRSPMPGAAAAARPARRARRP